MTKPKSNNPDGLRQMGKLGSKKYRSPKPVKKCKVEGCPRDGAAKGMCHTHYRRYRLTGSTDGLMPEPFLECSVPNCTRDAEAKGMCSRHYRAVQRDPNLSAESVKQSDSRRSIEDLKAERELKRLESGEDY